MPPMILDYVIPTIHVLACLFLIVVVLLQTGKGADMGAVFGGGSQTLFGSGGAGNFLTKLTTGCAIAFMLTSLVLTYGRSRSASSNLLDRLPDAPAATAPADEAATPPAAGDAAAPAGEQPAVPAPEANVPADGAPAAAAPANEPTAAAEPQAAAPAPAANAPAPAAPEAKPAEPTAKAPAAQ